MKSGKSVVNGSKGGSMPLTVTGGLAQASKDSDIGKVTGSPELATSVVGASHGPSVFARGNAAPANTAQSEIEIPDPEVKMKRRRHGREYKLQILRQTDKLRGQTGAIGELLRREGLYSSTLFEWRKQREEGLLGQARGRKPADPLVHENEHLKKERDHYEKKFKEAVLIIEAQKKIAEILGNRQDDLPPMPSLHEGE